jgi:hypothetical protein
MTIGINQGLCKTAKSKKESEKISLMENKNSNAASQEIYHRCVWCQRAFSKIN